MKLLLATHNKNKIIEIKNALQELDVELLSLDDFPDLPDVIEDGDTLEHNSLKKAREIFEYSGITTLADDTGLEIEYLNGDPGVYSARWAGEDCSYEDNNRKMLRELDGVSIGKRDAVFRCVITLFGENLHETTEGVLKGKIIEAFKGQKGFGYDPIFKPEGFDITLAEMSLDDKNKISHRGLAVKAMVGVIKGIK
ncbi:MAG: RdgB/HAM1 family non-canonical purine NTP pyrophosphatase [Candidatus Delongbacteria bacterium]|jgi:XTP/dITP diphosphohydrolase|nr:RdgB/HAM1 family non-canonical purine NTP pyrophosphatase [Candidatus Delongbacteria bacterium]